MQNIHNSTFILIFAIMFTQCSSNNFFSFEVKYNKKPFIIGDENKTIELYVEWMYLLYTYALKTTRKEMIVKMD